MVTVQHPAGIAAYWQSTPHHHLLPAFHAACGCTAPAAAAAVVPVHWHGHTPLTPSPSLPAATPSALAQAAAFVPAVQSAHTYAQTVATVEPEQPIGYGSFGVVW